MKTYYCFNSFISGNGILASVLAVFALLLLFTVPTQAVTNNAEGMPADPVLNQMASWGQTTNPNYSSGRMCGDPDHGFNNAQAAWISVAGNTLGRSITLSNPSQNTVSLQFNTVGATCDSAINSQGKIVPPYGFYLKQTDSHIQEVETSFGTVSGYQLGYHIVDYNAAQFYNLRYTSIQTMGPFTLSGLASLPAGTHTITVTVTTRPINLSADGIYRCVSGGAHVSGFNHPSCPRTRPSFQITIIKPFANPSYCSITVPNNLRNGQRFTASFTVKNGGNIPNNETWSTTSMMLGSTDPRDNTRFGAIRVPITPNNGAYGGVLQAGHQSTSTQTFTMPASGTRHLFSWGLLKEHVAWYDNYVKCSVTISTADAPPPPPPQPPPPTPPPPIYLRCEILSISRNVKAGQVMPVTVRIKNDSDITLNDRNNLAPTIWRFGSLRDTDISYTNEFPLHPTPGTVPVGRLDPGTSQTVSFEVKAPLTPKQDAIFLWALHNGPNLTDLDGLSNKYCLAKIDIESQGNLPYISVTGSDVYSGASFGSACQPTPAAQSANIRTNGFFNKENTNGKLAGYSGSQYAVFASGAIGSTDNVFSDNTFLGNYGYNRTSPPGMENVKDALFSNINHDDDIYGEFYDGGASGMPCIKIPTATDTVSTQAQAEAFIKSGQGIKQFHGNVNITGLATPVASGTKKTLIVNGNVTLTSSITYAGSESYSSLAAIPHLTIIARNIFVTTNATTIDAHLIAYPTADSADGVIDTCSDMQWHDSSGSLIGATPGQWLANGAMAIGSCKKTPVSFVVNGSMTARRILWKRTNGTVGLASSVADPSCNFAVDGAAANNSNAEAARMKACAAELIQFNPEALLPGFTSGSAIDNVPRSTTELPPIY